MKLTQDRFMSIIAYMSAYYPKFDFKLMDDGGEPSYQFKVWYQALREFDEETIVKYVESYCRENVYPPQSPTHVLEYVKGKVADGMESPAEAWQTLYSTVQEMGYRLGKVEKRLVAIGKPVIAKSYAEIQDRFYGLLQDDIPYVRKEFIEVYQRNVRQSVSTMIDRGELPKLEHKKMVAIENRKE